MDPAESNPLISSQKSSELQVVLHPLVLLTISDYITRHTLRGLGGPIIGAVLGQHNGREITLEHAFECQTLASPFVEGGYSLHEENFAARLDQMKTVHRDRGLDLVGWYTLLPRSGPTPTILAIHKQFLEKYNESSLVLGFHPEEVIGHSVGGKLPLTIYESNEEHDDGRTEPDGEDKKMKDGESPLKLRFRELSYSVETGEAEMISMDFVARGGGNATAVESPKRKANVAAVEEADLKGKNRMILQSEATDEGSKPTELTNADVALSREEEEMIAAITARSNAIKMLHSRVQLIMLYLERLPSSFQNSPPAAEDDAAATSDLTNLQLPPTQPSYTILRSIQALVSRLDLIVPSDVEAFEAEMLRERNDVQLVYLLNEVMQSIHDAREAGKKFGIVENAKVHSRKTGADFAGSSSALFSLPGSSDFLV